MNPRNLCRNCEHGRNLLAKSKKKSQSVMSPIPIRNWTRKAIPWSLIEHCEDRSPRRRRVLWYEQLYLNETARSPTLLMS